MGLPVRTAIACLTLPLWSGCGNSHPPAKGPYEVVRSSPELDADPRVCLNQELTVFFADPVDPLSVTADSVSVLDADGHGVAGRLRVRSHAISFVPEVPLQADLADGSLLPDAQYELRLSGYPNADGVAAADGRRLSANYRRTFRTLPRDTSALGLPSPLLPVAPASMPFLMIPVTGGSLAAGNPRPRLHFTLPVLPSSLTLEAFAVKRFRFVGGHQEIVPLSPRGARLLSDPRDEHPGSTVELDLDGAHGTLQPEDIVIVDLTSGDAALRDYAGRALQMLPGGALQSFSVVAGGELPLWEWPGTSQGFGGQPGNGLGDSDGLMPTFEILADRSVRPQLRVEAGDGSLGRFAPRRDTVLRAGTPFDLGDGKQVLSNGSEFAFLSIDIPAGVTVRIDGSGEAVRLLACGSIRIDGVLVIAAPPFEVRTRSRSWEFVPVQQLLEAAPVTLISGGNLLLNGSIRAEAEPTAAQTACCLIAGGRIERRGSIPPGTILGVETGSGDARLRGIDDPLAVKLCTRLQPGLPDGARLTVSGATPWTRMPDELVGARLELVNWQNALQVWSQQAGPDPLRPDLPDLHNERQSPLRRVVGGTPLGFPQGVFLRFLIQAEVRGGEPLPTGRRLLLWER